MHRIRYLLGLLTLLLAAGGAWYLFHVFRGNANTQGLAIRVEFRDARGLRSGADVRYRGVNVGAVLGVRISDDGSKAVADLLFDEGAAAQVCVNSTFWIVSPRFQGIAAGASGLDTLVRDAYVAFVTPAEHGSSAAASSPAPNDRPRRSSPIHWSRWNTAIC
jgi:paraquat-inducible protein B